MCGRWGRSRVAHWWFIALQWGPIVAILGGLWLQGEALRALFAGSPMRWVTAVIDPTGVMERPVGDWAVVAATASLYSLAGVLLFVEISRLISLSSASRGAARRLAAG